MKKTKRLKTGALIAAATAVLLSAGCQEKTKPKESGQLDNPVASVVTVVPYPEKLPYDTAYRNATGGGGGEHPGIFFGHIFTPYSSFGGSTTHYGSVSPGIVGRGLAPYAPGTLRTGSVRAYSPGSPGARAVSRGGFGGRAGSFSVGG
jgi:hypothetical protein